mmetsp:Transcript_2792/g.4176  ORF Transcript_2792/g.4176 Transcript_2792/m.4176 type:complete len:429 (+) Transcript_2792:145-1431(+)
MMEFQALGSYIFYTVAFLPILGLVVLNILFMGAFLSMHPKRKKKEKSQKHNSRLNDAGDANVPCCPEDEQQSRQLSQLQRMIRKEEENAIMTAAAEEFQFHSLPDDVITYVYHFLSPKSITTMTCVNRSYYRSLTKDKLSSTLWQSLWFRDYGFALLEWEISRLALHQSCMVLQKQLEPLERKNENDFPSSKIPSVLDVTHQLQEVFRSHIFPNMKRFYFEFQQTYVDYCLVGCNTPSRCYLGLHGHIINFTHYAPHHPGMDGILFLCGGDLTTIFEQMRHSSVAKTIATKLCVFTDESCCYEPEQESQSSSNDNQFGLKRVVHQSTNSSTASWLSNSNSRPPTMNDRERSMFPEDQMAAPRRPLTLQSIRTRFDTEQKEETERQQLQLIMTDSITPARAYYDPLLREWKGWYTEKLDDDQWKTVLTE